MAVDLRPNVPDPDLRHLLDLISLLPPPHRTSFWDLIAALLDDRDEPMVGMTGYVLEKLAGSVIIVQHLDDVGSLSGYAICESAKYLAIFFGAQKQELWDLLGSALTHTTDEAGGLGKAWADELMRTACVLVGRYSNEDNLAAWEARR